MVSASGLGGLRPVIPGVFMLRRWAKSRLLSSSVAVSCRNGSCAGVGGLNITGVCVILKVLGQVSERKDCCCSRDWCGVARQLSAMGSCMWSRLVVMVWDSCSVSVLWFGHVQRACVGVWVSALQSGHWSVGNVAGLVLFSLVLHGSVLLRVWMSRRWSAGFAREVCESCRCAGPRQVLR